MYNPLSVNDASYWVDKLLADPDSVVSGASLGSDIDTTTYTNNGPRAGFDPSFHYWTANPTVRTSSATRPTNRLYHSEDFSFTPPPSGVFAPIGFNVADIVQNKANVFENPALTQANRGYGDPSYLTYLSELLIGSKPIEQQTAELGSDLLNSFRRRGLTPTTSTQLAVEQLGARSNAYDDIFGTGGGVEGLNQQGFNQTSQISDVESAVNPVNQSINNFVNNYGLGDLLAGFAGANMSPSQIKRFQLDKRSAGIPLQDQGNQELSTVFPTASGNEFEGQINRGI